MADTQRHTWALERNRKRREAASAELDAARQELRDLLVEGRRMGFSVTRMCHFAGISRQTAHKVLRGGGD